MLRFSLRTLLVLVFIAAVLSFATVSLLRKPPLRDQVLAALEADRCDYTTKVEFPKHRFQVEISDGCPSLQTIELMAEWSKRSLHMHQPAGALRTVVVNSKAFSGEAEKAMDAAFAHKSVIHGVRFYSDLDINVEGAQKVR